jgi:ABC-type phosphate transport system auxiliary subunit
MASPGGHQKRHRQRDQRIKGQPLRRELRQRLLYQPAVMGLSLGSVLLLAALGLAITYGLLGVINMAHGEMLQRHADPGGHQKRHRQRDQRIKGQPLRRELRQRLGSVLLLAALGLAITYGLLGVINMAHGEMLMIGAYPADRRSADDV